MSLREGVSSLRNPHRGYGLHHVTGDVKWGVRPSMGSVGDCYDNALCEHNKNREMTIRSGQGILNIRGDGKVQLRKITIAQLTQVRSLVLSSLAIVPNYGAMG